MNVGNIPWAAHAKNVDCETLSAVLLGSMANYQRQQWTLGVAPLKVDEERFLSGWVAVAMATLDAKDLPNRKSAKKRKKRK